jgi:hypothetical protein
LKIEDDDDVREGAAAMFGIDLGDGPIDVDAGDGGVDGSEDTNGASSGPGKLSAACWEDFIPVFDENQVRTHPCANGVVRNMLLGIRFTSRDVVINDVTLTSLKTPEWSQLIFCDDFVTILFWSLWWRHICSSVTKLVFPS